MLVLEEHVRRRREIHDLYVRLLKEVKGVRVMCQPGEEILTRTIG